MTKHLSQALKGSMLCVSIALMASCQECELTSSQSDDLAMSIVANISPVGSVVQSRYAGGEPNLVEFAEGDAIGRSDITYLEPLPIFNKNGEPIT